MTSDSGTPAQPPSVAAHCDQEQDDHAAPRQEVEHPPPTDATVKELYAHAFTCAHPDCAEWLYRPDAQSGTPVLNSRVAHIHSRRPGGPRWRIGMPSTENRDASNLLLLCIPHSFEVDDHAERFPAEMLHQWRLKQRDEHRRLRKAWPLSDEEAQEAASASFDTTILSSRALIDVVRVTERLAVKAQRSRLPVAAEAAAWRRTWDQVRAMHIAWDQDGNRIYAEPSPMDTERHEAALCAALAQARDLLQPHAQEVQVEAAAARAAVPRVADRCDWLTRASGDVTAAASRWPGPPPLDDDDALSDAIGEMRRAGASLAAALRGDPTSDPPPTPAPAPPAAKAEADDDALRRHQRLLDRARPFARVQHRPHAPDLRAQLVVAAQDAATIPPVPAALAIGLRATARLAAAVARNADPTTLAALIDQDRTRRPLCAASVLLHELKEVLEEQGHEDLAHSARDALVQEMEAQDWSQAETWTGNEHHGRAVFAPWAWFTSPQHPRVRLAAALREQPERLRELLLCCADWVERHDTRTGAVRYERVYEYVPEWLPTDAVAAAAAAVLPNVTPAADRHDDQHADEVEHLLAHVLRLTMTST